MSDGSGTLAYTYDSLSRLSTETKTFSDDLQNPYTLAYEYFLGGGLKSIDGPFHHKTTYAADTLGRITKIGAAGNSNLSGDTAYASDIKYRAFGAVKEMKLSTTAQTTVNMTYDDALRPATYLAHNTVSGDIQSSSYVYSGDGMNKQITNGVHSEFNQISQYDFAGRLRKNDVGHSGATYPFKQTMSYDAFDNLTTRETYTWQDYHDSFTATYANNRKTLGGTTDYSDSAGNVLQSNFYTTESPGGGRSYNDLKNWTFDAAGRMTKWDEHGPWEAYPQTHSAETTYDGDGRPVMTTTVDDGGTFPWRYIYSSVTGQKIADVSPGYTSAIAANIYMGGSQIAQERDTDNTFDLHDPVTGSVQLMQPSGAAITTGQQSERYPYHTEKAGLGTAVPVTQPAAYPLPHFDHGGFGGDAEGGCRINGFLAGPKECNDAFPRDARIGNHVLIPLFKRMVEGGPRLAGFDVAEFDGNDDRAPDYEKMKQAVDACARRMFNVSVKKIDWARKGHDGKMDFTLAGAVISAGHVSNVKVSFSVYDNATEFSQSSSAPMNGAIGFGGGGTRGNGIYQYYEERTGRIEWTNHVYTASNADQFTGETPNGVMQTFSTFESVQIHETGNALSRLTGVTAIAGNWTNPVDGVTYHFGVPVTEDEKNKNSVDTDTGQAFELCAMVEYRHLTGYK